MATNFHKLNADWNADPNSPDPQLRVAGNDVILTFFVNGFIYPHFKEGDRAELRFHDCCTYRLGRTNDEGWYRGQCRFSGIAPEWGEFYEVSGDLKLDVSPPDWKGTPCPLEWKRNGAERTGLRHYLFYLKDETFECEAASWSFRTLDDRPNNLLQSTLRAIASLARSLRSRYNLLQTCST